MFVRALFSFFTNELDANLPNFNASETTRKKKRIGTPKNFFGQFFFEGKRYLVGSIFLVIFYIFIWANHDLGVIKVFFKKIP